MKKIFYENDKTIIPKIIYNIKFENGTFKGYGMINKFYKLNFIDKTQPINADFLNKYHFELYIEEYKKCKNNSDYIKLGNKIFKGESNETNKYK